MVILPGKLNVVLGALIGIQNVAAAATMRWFLSWNVPSCRTKRRSTSSPLQRPTKGPDSPSALGCDRAVTACTQARPTHQGKQWPSVGGRGAHNPH